MAVFSIKALMTSVVVIMLSVSSYAKASGAEALLQVNTDKGWVVDNYQNTIHSEGMGMGLLAAVHTKNEFKFQQIWNNAKKMQRADKLFAWKFDLQSKTVADNNNATDGDLYIADALIRASVIFNNKQYLKEARDILFSVEDKLIKESSHGLILMPAEYGFVDNGDDVINLSYYIFPMFDDFYKVTNNKQWIQLKKQGIDMVKYAYFGNYQLPPDWLILSDPVRPWAQRDPMFGHDAIRVPLFVYKIDKLNPVVSRYLRFAMKNKGTVNLKTNELAEYAQTPGMKAITLYLKGKYQYIPTDNYYDNALQVMIEAIN